MKITYRGSPVIFVDVEASTLDTDTFPIEIGWSVDDEQDPPSFLIKPAPGWDSTDAYQAGKACHGIPYVDLVAKGVHLLDIPGCLDKAWAGAILVSDNPQFDQNWVAQVYAELNRRSPWQMVELDVIFATLCQFAGVDRDEVVAIIRAADHMPRPHRAGGDALRMHKIVRMIVDPAWRTKILNAQKDNQ